jgi:hypothetical protein
MEVSPGAGTHERSVGGAVLDRDPDVAGFMRR